MKKLILGMSLVVAAMTAHLAVAETVVDEQKLQSAEEIDALLQHLGIADEELLLEAEEEFEAYRRGDRRRPPHHWRRPGHRPPRHHRPPHYGRPHRPSPPHYRATICYARSHDGRRFWSVSYSPYTAQNLALNQCYRYARYCYSSGCFIY